MRFGWCDLHGVLRGKTLTAKAAIKALRAGVGMVSTLLLKDTSDRTAFKVFEPGGTADLPGFAFASNLILLPDPASFKQLPWAQGTGWLRCQPWFQDGTPVPLDTRHVLQQALARLAQQGFGMVCGLEVEFHIYRIKDTQHGPDLDPEQAAWPGLPPAVSMIHPGYNLLAESWIDMAEEPLRIVQHTAQALGLPLQSLEIELGPSQVEAVFDATDAHDGRRQHGAVSQRGAPGAAPRRLPRQLHVPPALPEHHVQRLAPAPVAGGRPDGRNAFMRDAPAPGTTPADALHTLTDTGAAWLGGLLAHAQGMASLCTPTVNGFGRFRPNALAPQAVLWGRDNRGAMLRVVGGAGDGATRIENRIGEPSANPYLYMAAQIHAGLDGLARGLTPPRATESPYASDAEMIPTNLPDALGALQADAALVAGFGADFVRYYSRVKQSEAQRHATGRRHHRFRAARVFQPLLTGPLTSPHDHYPLHSKQ